MNNAPTLDQVRASLPAEKRRADTLWARLLIRELSFPVTWLFVRLGFTANAATYFSIFVVVFAAFLFAQPNWPLSIAGAALFIFFGILDCVDGNIARLARRPTRFGGWTDAVGGYIAYSAVFFALGFAAEARPGILAEIFRHVNFLALGAWTAIANLLLRVQYQHFRHVEGAQEYATGRQRKLSQEVGIGGLLMPILLLADVFGFLGLVLVGYAFYFTVGWAIVTIRLIMRAQSLENKA
ncbi:MAG TPA: CDP-alcohol phosphatidyltransferase family protein [Candidatus Thermoplasmatota archaeon]|nr:CDP-alcohol phosphatidyltransferase family protein [Candidatus Thermoplasmatota archaeon]